MAIPNLFLSLLLVSHVILSMPSPSFACLLNCESETDLLLYLHQIYSGPRKNRIVTFRSPERNQFGTTAIIDWAVLDSPQPNNASIVARAQGMHFKADVAGPPAWFSYFSIVFQGGRFRGSSFQVMGVIYKNEGQSAIIGGTGELAMARGVIKYKTVSSIPNYQSIKELRIHIIYAPPTGSIAGAAIL